MAKKTKVEKFFDREYKPSPQRIARDKLELEIGTEFKNLLIELRLFLRKASKRVI